MNLHPSSALPAPRSGAAATQILAEKDGPSDDERCLSIHPRKAPLWDKAVKSNTFTESDIDGLDVYGLVSIPEKLFPEHLRCPCFSAEDICAVKSHYVKMYGPGKIAPDGSKHYRGYRRDGCLQTDEMEDEGMGTCVMCVHRK